MQKVHGMMSAQKVSALGAIFQVWNTAGPHLRESPFRLSILEPWRGSHGCSDTLKRDLASRGPQG